MAAARWGSPELLRSALPSGAALSGQTSFLHVVEMGPPVPLGSRLPASASLDAEAGALTQLGTSKLLGAGGALLAVPRGWARRTAGAELPAAAARVARTGGWTFLKMWT